MVTADTSVIWLLEKEAISIRADTILGHTSIIAFIFLTTTSMQWFLTLGSSIRQHLFAAST
jgi:hypothetical protein